MAIHMPLPLEIILRFSLGSGQRRFTRFVAMASLIGMMLGVAALIMVLSVMNGFERTWRVEIVGNYAHFLVRSYYGEILESASAL